MKITKRFNFSASHRLFNPGLSDMENRSLFQECNRAHGHNFTLDITVDGPVDEKSGMVINFHELKDIVQKNVVDYFDHKDFEQDIPEFKSLVQTVENLVRVIWQRLSAGMPNGVKLSLIRIAETDNNWVEYGGE